jgi:hypothetical protein
MLNILRFDGLYVLGNRVMESGFQEVRPINLTKTAEYMLSVQGRIPGVYCSNGRNPDIAMCGTETPVTNRISPRRSPIYKPLHRLIVAIKATVKTIPARQHETTIIDMRDGPQGICP